MEMAPRNCRCPSLVMAKRVLSMVHKAMSQIITQLIQKTIFRRRTNVQQLTCKIDLSSSFYYLFFSFVLIELNPLF